MISDPPMEGRITSKGRQVSRQRLGGTRLPWQLVSSGLSVAKSWWPPLGANGRKFSGLLTSVSAPDKPLASSL